MASSSASSTCRIDWRPSRWLVAGLALIGLLAALALLGSGLPSPAAGLAAAGAACEGLRLAWCDARRAPLQINIARGQVWIQQAQAGRLPLQDPRWHVRGRFAWLRGRDGRGRAWWFAWGPDTLGTAALRELQLARGAMASTVPHPLVAP